ncbi:polyribonucleotide nucleotidyltransferase [Candidatus Berkelbacteria bacterium RIFCSPLOWO2_01_FULL_50_28]|uniref:Polyribonucleotide nucleotidyltransferase n=1 Tax=Candidatus Berkelbacteria bacterium RIFCSPLOWO2_01_FULL_50_28 TaxID=1797471 RepID=A0A1F5EC43_9BACT|nr:MAG: polyribonucleotide nucleotidyltransferase [Candidatus Berkelbacteria bacterium RIFCSPHIGHO2_01_FULL_50_36]OGD63568.1 MAG: polyribonucleotide nucleotidyltransferase [Candidatus Berkelbacteria bacterium RIFCSPHIGHO2_12_FULL_50_11]OGD64989.1 MAG: polyribonucleotide nucleotidyltransferase [Candidatus Berkelbacteria bacterium RIFCSPLOWO2_01_FULL_50_28]
MKKVTVPYGEADLVIESGKLAKQADGSVTLRCGDTVILATACVADKPKEGADFFPLTIDYEERMYAAGKISSSKFMKREGRPSEEAVLRGRLIDRSIRPMFPKGFRREVQVIVTTLSYDDNHDIAAMAVIGASCALLQTNAPFEGPVAAVRVGLKDDKFILNPTVAELAEGDLDLLASGTEHKITMIEVASREIPEAKMEEALTFAQKAIAEAIEPQRGFINQDKEKIVHVDPEHIGEVKKFAWDELQKIVTEIDLAKRHDMLKELEATAIEKFAETFNEKQVVEAIDTAFLKAIRALILDSKKRPDGRKMDEVRPLDIEVGILPRVHGSGLFNRGETQALTLVTLAGPGQEQHIDTMGDFGTKRYIHHYNFPPYATGEIKRLGGMNRREIGHGALAEKALEPMIPAKADFPYTIRLVSEILGSNGSSSMAATCGSTLALMDAGVPIIKPVAGIAMGMVASSDDDFQVLTDLQGLEDFAGEMDFKIAGTQLGITAIQLDVKNKGLTAEMIHATLVAALKGREEIMAAMLKVIAKPREELSKYAPRIITTQIDPEKIGELIGPGGKTINGIIDAQGGREILNIDIDDDGTVMITSNDAAKAEEVKAIVESIGKPVVVGEEFEGTVVNIQKDRMSGKEIGAIVQLSPNKDGMIHISALGNGQFVEKVSDVVKVGDKVKVKVKDVDADKGRISLVRIG